MKSFLKSAVLLVVLLLSSRVAHASVLDGNLRFHGSSSAIPAGIVLTGQSTARNSFTFSGMGSAAGGEQMFSAVNAAGTQNLNFAVNPYGVVNGKLTFFGTLPPSHQSQGMPETVVSSVGPVLAYTRAAGTDFSAAMSTTPEPNSLMLLGTGLGAVGYIVRRRRHVTA